MPNKTIYISDADAPLADRAAELSGGLSPAVVEGLKLLVARRDAEAEGFEEIHVRDDRDGASTTRIFHGRQLARLEVSDKGQRTTWNSYATPKGALAVVRTHKKDFLGLIQTLGPGESSGTTEREDLQNLRRAARDFLGNTNKRFADGRRQSFTTAPEWDFTVDIANDLARRFGVDPHRLSSGVSSNFGGLLDELDRFFGSGASSSQQSGSGADGRAQREGEGSSEKGRGFSNVIDHTNDDSEGLGADDTSAPDAADDPQPQDDSAQHPPRATHVPLVDSTLEVFENTEALRQAAFREANSAADRAEDGGDYVGQVPASFVTATERALNHPPVEYLDI
ncbi:hypothetical protein [Corynebacterium heidelbergense]|uniref:Uncharacterized protein n=1 Tax=Corynebacterium heidelbergense TaxID=2055947 RepID=A0A364V8I9_9CORY|nr:hypothetical protein [Corynebacterium heidelbergense]RAV32972.1 hypothetical protein DLJ54_00805 [Corynebacterium heidelbergense]